MGLKAKVLISAGSNMGDRKQNLMNAISLLRQTAFELANCSYVYQTPPWGFDADTEFYNICFSGYTELSPTKLIKQLLEAEEKLGRTRISGSNYVSRNIDLDIILWDNLLITSPILHIPHPRAHERRFVLSPAADIEPDWIHPVFNKNLETLLLECKDESKVEKLFALDLEAYGKA